MSAADDAPRDMAKALLDDAHGYYEKGWDTGWWQALSLSIATSLYELRTYVGTLASERATQEARQAVQEAIRHLHHAGVHGDTGKD